MTSSNAINAAFARHQAGDLDAAEAEYREILRSEPDNLNGLQLLGVLAHQRGRSTEAVDLLLAAAALLERSGDAAAPHAVLHNNLGNALRAVGRAAEAAAHYRRGIALDPTLAELHVNLGDALLAQGAPTDAIASYEAALRIGLRSAECLDRLSEAYAAVGWLRTSEQFDLSNAGAASANPALHRAGRWLGVARILNTRSEPAAAAFACRCVLQLAPDDTGARQTLAGILVDIGSPADAVAECRKLLAAEPEDAAAHYILGRALGDLGDHGGSIDALRRCLELDSRHAGALYNLGALLAKLGLDDLAIPLFEIAITMRPDDGRSFAALGNILQARGDAVRARACFERACELKPLSSWPASGGPAQFSALLLHAPGVANTPPEFLFGNSSFDRHLFALLPELEPDIELLQQHGHVVVNLISDADQGPKMLTAAAEVIDRLGKPTINHPRRVLATARDNVAKLLAGIALCRIPATMRMTREALGAPDAVASLEGNGFAVPLLLRVAGTHGGDAFEKIECADDITKFLAEYAADELYVTAHVDYRSADGYFRKYRFVFNDAEILPYHLAIGDRWKLHHYTTEMGRHAWMKAEEEAFLENPQSVFSPAHYEALAAIRGAIGLDFFGIDCTLDRDGNIVIFEVNASILIHDDNAEFPYKTPHCLRIKQAFESMLRRRVVGKVEAS